jgi:hypothetical protein
MQRILSLLQSGVSEGTIMEALNGISFPQPEEITQELNSEDITPLDFEEFLAAAQLEWPEFPTETDPTDQMTLFNT